MRVKKAGGKVFGAVLTAAERKAMDMEINRQIVEADRRYADDIDAIAGFFNGVEVTAHGMQLVSYQLSTDDLKDGNTVKLPRKQEVTV